MTSALPSAPPPSYDDANRDYQYNKGTYQQQQGYGQQGVPYGTYEGQYGASPNQYNPPAAWAPPPQNAGYGQSNPIHDHADEEHQMFNESSFSDKAIRHMFIRKVYLILMIQLLFTFAVVTIFSLVDPVKFWVQRNLWFYIVAYVAFIVTYIVLACCPGVRRKTPGNFIALAVFTLCFTYLAATIGSFHNASAVFIAAGITAVVALGISIFACQTKIDFTMCSGLIFAASLVLILVGFLYLIIFLAIPPGENGQNYYYLQCAYGGVAALILSLFLVFDTQMIVGGKNRKYQLSPEEYILGALELYLDIVNLFLIILSIVGGKK